MQNYCSSCKKHPDNICPKKLIMKNEKMKKLKENQDNLVVWLINRFLTKKKHKSERDVFFVSIFNKLNHINMLTYWVKCRKKP